MSVFLFNFKLEAEANVANDNVSENNNVDLSYSLTGHAPCMNPLPAPLFKRPHPHFAEPPNLAQPPSPALPPGCPAHRSPPRLPPPHANS
mmetsp:Transcript_30144/g.68066  ORF Transcript_30144/g.68066 Transcript_30144/m.68066 type:complete len:90 (-) Transcript_30144:1553-1822(-)